MTNTTRDREVFILLRAIYGMTDSEVARRTDLSPATIARLRKPVKDGEFHTMQVIAKCVGMHFVLVSKGVTDGRARTRRSEASAISAGI